MRGMYSLMRKARKLSATTYIRGQWIMGAIREINIAFESFSVYVIMMKL